MKQLYHVLILEDNSSDEGLMTNELKKAGVPFTFTRVETRDDFVRELAERRPDLILSDYTLPSFDGMAALSIVREGFPEIPFIFVTGTLGEENAIEALKNGATDYVLKDRLSKLSPAVIRALQDVEEKSARAKAETAQRESERRYRLMIESAGLGIGFYDLEGMLIYFNKISLSYMNGSLGDFVGQSVHDIYDKDLADQIMDRIKEAAASEEVKTYEDYVTIPAGSHWFRSHYSRVLDNEGRVAGVQILSENITERKRVEELLRVKDRALDSSINAIALGGLDGKLTYVNPAFLKMWGYRDHREVEGRSAIEFWVSPDEAAQVIAALQNTGQWSGEMKAANKDGGAFDLELTACIILDVNGEPVGMFAAFQDITERKRAEEDIQRQLNELQRWYAVTIDREERVSELKKEVNDLFKEAGRPGKYGE